MARGVAEQSCLDYIKDNLDKIEYPLMESDDRAQIQSVLMKAIPNPSLSEFPDFLCEDGFIEHFKVTAAHDNAKGSMLERKSMEFETQCKDEFSDIPQWEGTGPIEIHTDVLEMNPLDYQMEWFHNSIRKHTEKHLKSLRKYKQDKRIKIFLIENKEQHLRYIVMDDIFTACTIYRMTRKCLSISTSIRKS